MYVRLNNCMPRKKKYAKTNVHLWMLRLNVHFCKEFDYFFHQKKNK